MSNSTKTNPKPKGGAKKKTKRPGSDTAPAVPVSTVGSEKTSTQNQSNEPLFRQIHTKDGQTKIVCDTNNTLEMLEPIPAPVVHDKLDDVLAAVRQLDTTCDQPKCKAKTGLMFMDCGHCKQRFCFKHGLPEVHGCGDAIKRQERDAFQHPVPQRTKQTAKELENAKEKLHQKLKDMNLSRKSKPTSGAVAKK